MCLVHVMLRWWLRLIYCKNLCLLLLLMVVGARRRRHRRTLASAVWNCWRTFMAQLFHRKESWRSSLPLGDGGFTSPKLKNLCFSSLICFSYFCLSFLLLIYPCLVLPAPYSVFFVKPFRPIWKISHSSSCRLFREVAEKIARFIRRKEKQNIYLKTQI